MAALAEPGSISFTMERGEHPGEFGCSVAFETYRPDQHRSDVMVFLAHGFMRDLDSMRGWAAHWASYGVPVTVMSLCNSSWFAGHHDRNAIDMVTLADALHTGPVLYAGFSAGGLAAYLAAASDRRTGAYLGLDTVENSGLAQNAARELSYPVLFLLAEPSSCNDDNNILDALTDVSGYSALRIRNTTHCHYENPYDTLCESICGYVEPAQAQDMLIQTVRTLATAWVLEHALDHYSLSPVSAVSSSARAPWSEHVEVLR